MFSKIRDVPSVLKEMSHAYFTLGNTSLRCDHQLNLFYSIAFIEAQQTPHKKHELILLGFSANASAIFKL
jgi:hypothetical protein